MREGKLRESLPWPQDIFGLYAGAHTVAEMKRTNRDKDWAFVTALGMRMIEADDECGWLHIFEADSLKTMLRHHASPRPRPRSWCPGWFQKRH